MDVGFFFVILATYGGNPLGCAVGMEAMKVLIEEKMVENSKE
jgi:ornithine--oxo-acid transaminase